MWWLIARRLGSSALIVILVVTVTFFLIRLAPGDPLTRQAENTRLSEARRAALRRSMGIDRPLAEQYVRYMINAAHGDLGVSTTQGRPVLEMLGPALRNTLRLMGVALLASFTLGIAVGVAQGARRHSWSDRIASVVALFFYSMPDFWLALMAMLIFAQWLGWFPTSGMNTAGEYGGMSRLEQFADAAKHLVLPATTLTLLLAAGIMRYQRSAVLDEAHHDYVRTARAKGVSERGVFYRHVLRNALLPTITLLGLYAPALLGGAVFVESVFAWPGMGYIAVHAIDSRDYPLVTGAAIISSVMVCVGSIVADLLYAAVDPRLRSA